MLVADTAVAATLSADELRDIELLLYQDTELLDQGRFSEWSALFTEDCCYWVPASVGQTDPLNEVSLFYEDRELMVMRIERIQHPQAHSLSQPLRSSHVVGQAVVTGAGNGAGELVANSRFTLTEYQRGRQRHFAGTYTHYLCKQDGNYRIRMKRVDLIDCDSLFEPLQVFI